MTLMTQTLTYERPLPFTGSRAVILESLFVAATVGAPLLAHALGWPVFVVLPMFWGVMLSGVVLGWKAGILAGLAAPILNHLLTGMPVAPMVPLMTVELALYGGVPALIATRQFRGSIYVGMVAGIVAGRVALLGGFTLINGTSGLAGFIRNAVLPGVPMQLAQILLIPIIGNIVIQAIRSRET